MDPGDDTKDLSDFLPGVYSQIRRSPRGPDGAGARLQDGTTESVMAHSSRRTVPAGENYAVATGRLPGGTAL